jgi:hypothetical protein
MAACSPKPFGRLVNYTEAQNPGTVLETLTKEIDQQLGATRPKMAERWDSARQWLQWIGYKDPQVVLQRLADAQLLKAVDNGDPLAFEKMSKVNIDELSSALAATKVYYQSLGGGLQGLADNLINKARAGEDILEAGRAFAFQARGIAKVGDFILDSDRKLGQGLLVQKFQSSEFGSWAMQRFKLDPKQLQETAVQNADDLLTRVAKGLNSGDDRQIQGSLRELLGYAELIRLSGSPENAAKMTNQLHNAGNMIWTVAINGLLSSPATAVVNLVSGTYAFARPLMQLGAAWSWQAMGLPKGQRGAQMAASMAMAELQGMADAWGDAWRLGYRSFLDGRTLYSGNMDVNKAQEALYGGWNAGNVQQLLGNRLPIKPGDSSWDMINLFGKVLTTPGNVLQASDDLVKHLAIRGQVRSNAVRRAIEREGFDVLAKPADMAAYFAKEQEYAFNPAAPDFKDMWQLKTTYDQYARTMGEAKYVTFQEDNSFADGVQNILSTPVIGPLMRPFVPFVRTPINIMKQGFLDSTGIGGLIKQGQLEASEGALNIFRVQDRIVKGAQEDPAAFFRHAGQVAAMGTLAAASYAMVMNGQVTGGGPRRWSAERNKWEVDESFIRMRQAQGFSTGRYEIKTPIGVIPLARLGEPFAMPLKMIADLAEMSGYMSSTEQDETMSMISYVMVSGLFQGSFLEGMNTMFQLMFDDDPSGKKTIRAVQDYASVFTPFGSLLGMVGQVTNPYREVFRGQTEEDAFWGGISTMWDAFTARIQNRIPGYGSNPLMRDPIFGEPVPISPGVGTKSVPDILQLAIPFMPRGAAEQDSLYEDIYRLTGGYQPYRGPGEFKLTIHEQQRLNQMMGQVMIGGETKAQAFRRYMSQPDVRAYMATPFGTSKSVNTKFEEEFRKIESEYGRLAFMRMVAEDPGLTQRYALHEGKKRAKASGDGKALQELQNLVEQGYQQARATQRQQSTLAP